jgi:hypothetical protein
MVLIRWLGALGLALGAALPAGCNQSLFDNHGGGGTGGDGGPDSPVVPSRCADPCIADAAADWTGSSGGAGNRWRYLDDHRNRTWAAMTPSGNVMNGADPRNHITSCKSGNQDTATCTALPGALLISSSGATSSADPAIELAVAAPQVIQVTLRVYVPGGDDQQIVLYRNSREDALYTGVATVGKTLEQTIVLDALAKDRFLLAVAPTAMGASNVGVQLFASGTRAVFPQTCQLALGFDGASGTSIKDLCKTAGFDSRNYDDATGNDTAAAIALMPGPFAELGSGLDLPSGRYLQGTKVLDQTHDLTVQLWMLQRNQDTVSAAWVFSDIDLSSGGGLGMATQLLPPTTPDLDATTSLDPRPNTYLDTHATIGGPNVWQFLRVVHAGGTLKICVDGKLLASSSVPVGQLRTSYPPHLGRNVMWSPAGAFYDGAIDDVRVFTGALPCD